MTRSHGRNINRRMRKELDRDIAKATILIAKGEVSASDKTLITKFLGRIGLESQFMTQAAYEERLKKLTTVVRQPSSPEKQVKEKSYSFAEITSPEQFVVREHVVDFVEQARRQGASFPSKNMGGRTFNILVDGQGSDNMYTYADNYPHPRQRIPREPLPLDGIIVANREEVGFEPYSGRTLDSYGKSRDCADYALQAGSIVELSKLFSGKIDLSKTEEMIVMLGQQLQYQFSTNPENQF